MRRLAAGIAVLTFAISGIGASTAGAQETSEARGLITAADLPSLQLADFAARPYDDKYGPGLEATCANAAEIKAITGAGTTVGLGSTLSDTNGRVVIRTQTLRTTNVRAARKLAAALTTPECAALVGGSVLSGVVAQYPVLPTLTYGAPVDTDDVVNVPFTGASSIGPLGGTLLITQADNTIGLAAVRVSTPVAGQVEAITAAVIPTFEYETAVGSTPPPAEKVVAAATALGTKLKDTFTSVAQQNGATNVVAQDTPTRRGAFTYPPSCGKLAAAYTFSGARAATSGAAIQGTGGKVQARVEGIAFPTAKEAQIYGNYYKDLDACLGEIWATPSGTQASGIVRAPATGLANGTKNCQVQYVGTWVTPGTTTPALTRAVGVKVSKNGVSYFTVQTGDGSGQNMAIGMCD